MFASSSSDASICLKCHLRQALRQIAPRSRSGFEQCRYQSTEATRSRDVSSHGAKNNTDDSKSNPPIRKTVGESNFVTNSKKREARFRETSAKLPISSLNKETEVIILRTLPKRKARGLESEQVPTVEAKSEDRQSRASQDSPTTPSETPSDNPSTYRLSQQEVDRILDQEKARYEDVIVTFGQYQARLGELARSYNTHQLRRYAASRRTSLPLRMPERAALAIVAPDVLGVNVVPWTPIGNQKPVIEEKVQKEDLANILPKDRRMFAKRRIADDILRNCWGLKVETELSQDGELVFELQPDQFNLWSNSTSPQVDQVQPSSRFYTNSKLRSSAAQRTVTITGPRGEVESMADTLRQAFTTSVFRVLDLLPFQPLLEESTSHSTFAELFSPWQLRHTMSLTNTHVEYNADSNQLKMGAFLEKDVNDACRVLVSLLPLPSRNVITSFSPQQSTKDSYMVPNTNIKGLPYRHSVQQLGRLINPVERVSEPARALKGVASTNQDSLMKQILEHLPSKPKHLMSGIFQSGFSSRYWQPYLDQRPWTASIGYALQPMGSPGLVVTNPSTVQARQKTAADESKSSSTFLPAFPTHLGVLRQLGHLSDLTSADPSRHSGRKSRSPIHLTAKLVPSPFTEFGPYVSTIFPEVELRFREQPLFVPGEPVGDAPPKELKFKGLQAVFSRETIHVALPDRPVDLQLSRKTLIKSRYAEEDPHIAKFAAEVTESERSKEGTIRAPESLRVMIPVRTMDESERDNLRARFGKVLAKKLLEAQGTEVEVLYLFTGFEYQERRFIDAGHKAGNEEESGVYFSSEHVLRVEHVEGGLTGGKRMQVTVQERPKDPLAAPSLTPATAPLVPATTGTSTKFSPLVSPAQPETGIDAHHKLIRTSFSLIDIIDRVQKSEIEVKPAKVASARERSREKHDRFMKAKEQKRLANEPKTTASLKAKQHDTTDSLKPIVPIVPIGPKETIEGQDVDAADFLEALGLDSGVVEDVATEGRNQ